MNSGLFKAGFAMIALLIAVAALRTAPRPRALHATGPGGQTNSVLPLAFQPMPPLSSRSNEKTNTEVYSEKQGTASSNQTTKSETKPISRFEKTLVDETLQLFVPHEDPAATDRRLQRLAENLNAVTAAALVRTALDSRKAGNERFLAVYLLGERAPSFTRELQLIALQPLADGHEAGDVNVRIQAMIALESVQGQTKLFEEIQKRQTDRLLLKLAKLGAKGSRQGQPFIQKYVDMQMAEILHGVD